MSDLDAIIVKGAIEGVKDIVKEVVKSAAHFGQRELKKVLIDFQIGFESFLERNYRRISRIELHPVPKTPS